MSLLIDSMACVDQPWKAQVARMITNHVSFFAMYAPGWIVCGFIMHFLVFKNTNLLILIISQLLSGFGRRIDGSFVRVHVHKGTTEWLVYHASNPSSGYYGASNRKAWNGGYGAAISSLWPLHLRLLCYTHGAVLTV